LTATTSHLDANTEAALSKLKSAVLKTSNQNGQKERPHVDVPDIAQEIF
jgi:hypothetical protein